MTIILDAMGSDEYPDPEVLAAIQYTKTFNEELFLVGNEAILKEKIASCRWSKFTDHYHPCSRSA